MKNISFLLFLIFSCQHKEENNDLVYVDVNPYTEDTLNSLVDAIDTFDDIEPWHTIEPEIIPIPYDSMLLVLPGYYHGDEIPEQYSNRSWVGIIKKYSGYYAQNLPLSIVPYEDVIMGDEEEMTGKKIVVDSTLDCTFMISGLAIDEGSLNAFSDFKNIIYPSDTLRLDSSSFLFVIGEKQQTRSLGQYIISNYHLYISNGLTNQLIAKELGFDDAMLTILWIGDLDRDGKFDLLIDTSNHYNRTSPTLFLSSQAESNNLLKKVAILNSVGC